MARRHRLAEMMFVMQGDIQNATLPCREHELSTRLPAARCITDLCDLPLARHRSKCLCSGGTCQMAFLQRLNEGSFVKQLHQEGLFVYVGMYKEMRVPIPVIHWWIKCSEYSI